MILSPFFPSVLVFFIYTSFLLSTISCDKLMVSWTPGLIARRHITVNYVNFLKSLVSSGEIRIQDDTYGWPLKGSRCVRRRA